MITPLSQRDPQWKDIKIGNSTSTIGSYGCTLTCLAMMAGLTPVEFNQRMTAVGGYSVDRVIWAKVHEACSWLNIPDGNRYYSYDNEKVLGAIKQYGSCLVQVDFDGITSTPNDQHWVLYTGNGKMVDPWTGNEVSTGKYPLVKGFVVVEISPKENTQPQPTITLTDDQKNILKFLTEQKADEGLVRQAFGVLSDLPKLDQQIKDLTASATINSDFLGQLANLLGCPATRSDVLFELTKIIATASLYQTTKDDYDSYKLGVQKTVQDEVAKQTFSVNLEKAKVQADLDRANAKITDLNKQILILKNNATGNKKTILDVLREWLKLK